jgi:hypothetical protein
LTSSRIHSWQIIAVKNPPTAVGGVHSIDTAGTGGSVISSRSHRPFRSWRSWRTRCAAASATTARAFLPAVDFQDEEERNFIGGTPVDAHYRAVLHYRYASRTGAITYKGYRWRCGIAAAACRDVYLFQ